MKISKLSTLGLFLFLAACGGGGSGDSVNSSFNGEVSLNGQKYKCPSQKTYDACSASTNRDCSGCTTTQNPGATVITSTCIAPATNTYSVSQDGCVVDLPTGKQTTVCVSGSLKLLSGTGFTKTQVSSQGISFTNGVIINGVSIKCAV
jgi:hypothetical protein